jgi:Uncharacterized protein with a C-terminal OMP (outer membrane protein) domain
LTLLALSWFFLSCAAYSLDIREVKNADDHVVFELHFFSDTDPDPFRIDNNQPIYSTRTFQEHEIEAIIKSAEYWVERVFPHGEPVETVQVNLGAMDEMNANCGPSSFTESMLDDSTILMVGGIQQVLAKGKVTESDDAIDAHATAAMGTLPWSYGENSQLQESGGVSLTGVFIHEFGHGMGILGIDQYVFDEDGKKYHAMDEMAMLSDRSNPEAPLFLGSQATAVYGDLVWGGNNVSRTLPLNYEGGATDLGHFTIHNLNMTHVQFRNYTGFMEVELAAIQDLGYAIDRRNFFGKSVYVDNQTLVNEDGFFLRRDGQYVPGEYNTSSYGLGLHVFASCVNITQKGDLLTKGYAGAGIRSDGSNNHVIIDKGVKVHANGDNGTGLLVAYGSNSSVTHRGDLQALGRNGIAARFDLGYNLNSNAEMMDQQYSYYDMRVEDTITYQRELANLEAATDPADIELYSKRLKRIETEFKRDFDLGRAALSGALLDRFDVTGCISGRRAAIYVGQGAHVKEINLMRGSIINGSVITDYDNMGVGTDLGTALTFGRLADINGNSTDKIDPLFDFTIDFPIYGSGTPAIQFGGKGHFDIGIYGGRTTVGQNADIRVRGIDIFSGNLSITGGKQVEVADRVRLYGQGELEFTNRAGGGDTATFNAGGGTSLSGLVRVGAGNTLSFGGGAVDVDGGVMVFHKEANEDLGKIFANNGATVNRRTEVVALGALARELDGQNFMMGATGIIGASNLYSDFFSIGSDGYSAFLGSMYDMPTIQNNLFGSAQSRNLVVGAAFTEANMGSFSRDLQDAIESYVLSLQNPYYGVGDQHRAFAQLYGEHAVQGQTALQHTVDSFTNYLDRHIGDYVGLTGLGQLSSAALGSSSAHASMAPARTAVNRIWGGGFGAYGKQNWEDSLPGYKFKSAGAILGYDHVLSDNFILGIAGSYSRGETKISELGTKYESDLASAGLYASWRHESGFFSRLNAGYAHGWNDYDVDLLVGGGKSGKYDSDSFFSGLELGYEFQLPGCVALSPSAGVNYRYIRNDGWAESVAGDLAIANEFKRRSENAVDIPLTVRINKSWDFGNGCYVVPEARVSWIYAAKKNRPMIMAGYAGTGVYMPQYGVDPGRDRWRLGTGLRAKFAKGFDAGLDYDFEVRKNYRNHQLSLSLGMSY